MLVSEIIQRLNVHLYRKTLLSSTSSASKLPPLTLGISDDIQILSDNNVVFFKHSSSIVQHCKITYVLKRILLELYIYAHTYTNFSTFI